MLATENPCYRRALRVCASALVLAFVFGRLPKARAGITDAVKAVTLKNDLRVLVLENHKAPVATLNIFYKVGSRNEQISTTGISHLVEHLMFRGTKNLKPEEFSNIIQENGGMDNAFTTADYTDYFEVINKDHLDVPISLEAERMGDFDPQGFDSEKAVVIEERRMRTEDNPQDALSELTQAQAYLAHPYHWPVIGWMHDIQNLTLRDALTYHLIYYSPQNAIVVAVGDFDGDKVIKQISEAFGAIRNGPKPPPVTDVEPPQEGERHATLKHAAELPAFTEGYHVPNYKSPDSYALEIASVVLAGGKSSRLYQELVMNRRMVVDVDASYDRLSFDPTLFWGAAQLRPGIRTADVVAVLDQQIAALRDHPVSDQELQKAKNQEQADFVYGQDSIFREAMMLGQYEMLGSYKMLDQYLDGIDKVTAADVQRVAKQYLVDSNRTIGVLVPTGMLRHPAEGPSGGAVHHVITGEESR
jgi:zinc protease